MYSTFEYNISLSMFIEQFQMNAVMVHIVMVVVGFVPLQFSSNLLFGTYNYVLIETFSHAFFHI